MSSFNGFMQTEKIAIIALAIIIVGAISVYLASSNGVEIFGNLFENEQKTETNNNTIQFGDCADINYIGRYASNGTVFDTSYDNMENLSGETPLQVFVTLDPNEISPKAGYTTVIEGFAEGLIGVKENESKTIGPIPPEKAYGNNTLSVGDSFSTKNLALDLNQIVEVTEMTADSISLKWIDVDSIGKFTMPQMILDNLSSSNQEDMIIIPPPFSIWKNATEISEIYDDYVKVKVTPTITEKLADEILPVQYGLTDIFFIFPDSTNLTYDEDTIKITSNPTIGSKYQYSQDSGYGYFINITFTVENIAGETINISILYEDNEEILYQDTTKSLVFNRTFDMPRIYKKIPVVYQEVLFGEDLLREGYSLNDLAGESLIFEVVVEKIYKNTS